LKTAGRLETVPWVRIPPPPLHSRGEMANDFSGSSIRPPMTTTPKTEIFGLFRSLREPGQHGLAPSLDFAEHLIAHPDELGGRFALSIAQFGRYSNPRQFFHQGAVAPGLPVAAAGAPVAGAIAPVLTPPPPQIERTIDFASWLAAASVCLVPDAEDLAFAYVDRELDCMRRNPGVNFDDGTPSARALILDLLLVNATDGTPIISELKIRIDENPLYALIQALTAATHLVTPPQRLRLRNVYGLDAVRTVGPYLDVYVIFFEPPWKGLWPTVLAKTMTVAEQFLTHFAGRSLIRRVEFSWPALARAALSSLWLQRSSRKEARRVPRPRRASSTKENRCFGPGSTSVAGRKASIARS
jgi:hypothetical protein